MNLFHFLPSIHGLSNIANRRIRISRISSLNDPFELLLFACVDRKLRDAMRKAKDEFGQHQGLVCFSANFSNPLMWSHYGDRHKGICLGFEVNSDLINQVHYVDERPLFDRDLVTASGPTSEGLMKQNLTTKFRHWEYEQEWRLFVKLDHRTADSQGNLFVDFSEDLKLCQIIVGADANVSKAEVVTAIEQGNYSYPIDSFKVRAAFKSFRIVRNCNDKLWK